MCVIFNQVASIFHLGGGNIKKSFFGPSLLKKTNSNLNVALFEVLSQLANFLQRDRKPIATDVISDYE